MASSEFDTLAVASDLQAAGVQAAHAEAIVSAVAQATGRLVSESRFDTAITDLRQDMESGLANSPPLLSPVWPGKPPLLSPVWPGKPPRWNPRWPSSLPR